MFLILGGLSIQGVNALCGGHVIGYPGIPAFHGLANAICRDIDARFGGNSRADGVAILHHAGRLRASGKFGNQLTHKRTVWTDVEPNSRESAWFTPPSELQPQADIRISLIVQTTLSDEALTAFKTDTNALKAFVPPRALGGVVAELGACFVSNNPNDAVMSLRTGWFLVDKTACLALGTGDALSAMIGKLTDDASFSSKFVPIHTGYRAVSAIVPRNGTRDPEANHCFAEAITGLGRFARRHAVIEAGFESAVWHPKFDPKSKLYMFQGDGQ